MHFIVPPVAAVRVTVLEGEGTLPIRHSCLAGSLGAALRLWRGLQIWVLLIRHLVQTSSKKWAKIKFNFNNFKISNMIKVNNNQIFERPISSI